MVRNASLDMGGSPAHFAAHGHAGHQTVEAQVRHAVILEILRSARECELMVVYPSQRIVMDAKL